VVALITESMVADFLESVRVFFDVLLPDAVQNIDQWDSLDQICFVVDTVPTTLALLDKIRDEAMTPEQRAEYNRLLALREQNKQVIAKLG